MFLFLRTPNGSHPADIAEFHHAVKSGEAMLTKLHHRYHAGDSAVSHELTARWLKPETYEYGNPWAAGVYKARQVYKKRTIEVDQHTFDQLFKPIWDEMMGQINGEPKMSKMKVTDKTDGTTELRNLSLKQGFEHQGRYYVVVAGDGSTRGIIHTDSFSYGVMCLDTCEVVAYGSSTRVHPVDLEMVVTTRGQA